jgi:hypothetical protein
LVSYIKVANVDLCVREQGAEENIWTEEGGSGRRVEKIVL